MPQKIMRAYTPQMQADEVAIRGKLGIADGEYGGGGRSKTIAYAINNWAASIKNSPTTVEQVAKLTAYVEEYVRNTFRDACPWPPLDIDREVDQRVNLYFKEATVDQMELIGDWLNKIKDDVPMLLPVLKPSGQRKVSAYNHTLIVMLALAREARSSN